MRRTIQAAGKRERVTPWEVANSDKNGKIHGRRCSFSSSSCIRCVSSRHEALLRTAPSTPNWLRLARQSPLSVYNRGAQALAVPPREVVTLSRAVRTAGMRVPRSALRTGARRGYRGPPRCQRSKPTLRSARACIGADAVGDPDALPGVSDEEAGPCSPSAESSVVSGRAPS